MNFGKYIEYVVDKVDADCIKVIYVPKLFKDRIDLPEDIMAKITWCKLKANYYCGNGKENCPDDVLE